MPESVCRVVDDGFWYWSKEKPSTLLVEFHPGIADLPPGYTPNRKWHLPDSSIRSQVSPQAGLSDRLSRWMINSTWPLKVASLLSRATSQRPKRLVAAIDASRCGGLWTIESVKGFFLQPRTRELFAFVELLDSESTPAVLQQLEKLTSGRRGPPASGPSILAPILSRAAMCW